MNAKVTKYDISRVMTHFVTCFNITIQERQASVIPFCVCLENSQRVHFTEENDLQCNQAASVSFVWKTVSPGLCLIIRSQQFKIYP